ncbi:type I restriction enzyme S subunit [Curtobacterium sp. PhB136]|nr:type I restriction enzyme S subunit [Curtobacterium sp. PhB136]
MSWERHPIGDLLQRQSNKRVIQQGWSPKCHAHPAAPEEWGVLKTTAIQPGKFEPEHNKALPDTLDPRSNIEVKVGDLLITCAGPRARCGIPALVRHTRERLMMSGKMYRLRPKDRIDARFLEMYLLSPFAQERIDDMKTGISDSGLNLTHDRFVQLPVPVPPLEEQLSIVSMLEDHLSRIDAADAYLSAAERRVAAWQSAASAQELWHGDPPMMAVGRMLREPMRNGRSDRAAEGAAGGTRTLTLTAVTQNSFTDQFTKETVTPASVAQGLWLEPGDIFVQRANTPELVGTAARFDGPRNWAIFPDLLIRVRPDESLVDGRYLVAALRAERVHRALRARAKGLAGSMPKIDQRAVAETMVPFPDAARQREAIGRLIKIDAAAGAAIDQLRIQRRRSAALRNSLLNAAFAGELTNSTIRPDRGGLND